MGVIFGGMDIEGGHFRWHGHRGGSCGVTMDTFIVTYKENFGPGLTLALLVFEVQDILGKLGYMIWYGGSR